VLVAKDNGYQEDTEGARKKIDDWALQEITDRDAARARVAVARIKERFAAGPPHGLLVSMLVRSLRSIVETKPDAGAAEPLSDLLAGWATAGRADAVFQGLTTQPHQHPAMIKVFLAAAKTPSPDAADTLIGWLKHPTAGDAAATALRAIGKAAVPRLKHTMQTGDTTIRAKCRAVLADIAPEEAGPAGKAKDPALRPILADLTDVPGYPEAAAHLGPLTKWDLSKVSDADRDLVVGAVVEAAGGASHLPDWSPGLVRVMTRWATDRHADKVLRFVSSMGTGYDVSDLIALLGRARPKDAASAIVRATWNPKNVDAAVAAVAAIGPGAEPHLIQVLSRNRNSPKWVTTLAWMLEAVGTAKALPELETIRQKGVSQVEVGFGAEGEAKVKAALAAVDKAIAAIKAREKAKKDKK
jgi:hypothetical protein